MYRLLSRNLIFLMPEKEATYKNRVIHGGVNTINCCLNSPQEMSKSMYLLFMVSRGAPWRNPWQLQWFLQLDLYVVCSSELRMNSGCGKGWRKYIAFYFQRDEWMSWTVSWLWQRWISFTALLRFSWFTLGKSLLIPPSLYLLTGKWSKDADFLSALRCTVEKCCPWVR